MDVAPVYLVAVVYIRAGFVRPLSNLYAPFIEDGHSLTMHGSGDNDFNSARCEIFPGEVFGEFWRSESAWRFAAVAYLEGYTTGLEGTGVIPTRHKYSVRPITSALIVTWTYSLRQRLIALVTFPPS